jgi:hypothetical protein
MDNAWTSKPTCANMTLEIPTSNKHRTSRWKKQFCVHVNVNFVGSFITGYNSCWFPYRAHSLKSSFTIFAFNQVQISTYKFNQSVINTSKARSQALGYTLWFSLFSLKLNIFHSRERKIVYYIVYVTMK